MMLPRLNSITVQTRSRSPVSMAVLRGIPDELAQRVRCRMPIIEGFDFFPLKFDDHGTLQSRQEFDALIARANSRHRRDLHRARLSQRRERRDATLHDISWEHSGRTSRDRNSARGQSAVRLRRRLLAVEAVSRELRRGKERHTRSPEPSPAMADAKAQLEDLRPTTLRPAQRRNLDKAIALLPRSRRIRRRKTNSSTLVLSLVDTSTPMRPKGCRRSADARVQNSCTVE